MKEVGFARKGQKGQLIFTSIGKWDEKDPLESTTFYDIAKDYKNYQNAFPEQILVKDGDVYTAYKRVSKGKKLGIQKVGKFKGVEDRLYRGEIILIRA